ncbi:putative quinol monooxygenase [Occallatibacter riparius]|uniref:Antibiotic biosynthesis monooxygenase n=1 Tax=Occallatibacter riparius TaxID=1002689 RepID=A0A9J7BTF9_9BACT|nr:antibiotic biosynthesis monooxygenase [Occallatibacter riparius]UWZ85919.1 antibiotic biosynthesis monooxygenase [Occallatibacter riparius]
MTSRQAMIMSMLALVAFFTPATFTHAQKPDARIIRLAELEINPAKVEQYKVALREEISSSIRLEPGVITLYAVSVKDHPEKVRLFEMYLNRAAYDSHIQSPHFKKYKAETQSMVRSLTLVETDPILLGSK